MKSKKSSSLKQKVVSGLLVLIFRDFGMKVVAIFGQLLLVRVVAPEFFGIFAILTFIINAFDLITDLGFSQAIIQQQKKNYFRATEHNILSESRI